MSFWTPAIDPANPLACSQPERYVLRRLVTSSETEAEADADAEAEDAEAQEDAEEEEEAAKEVFLGIDPNDQSVLDVSLIEEAHHFRTQEAALRAAVELNRLGRGPLDVVKVGDP
jgi:hypothetical protein